MRRAAAIAAMRSSYLADRGRALAGLPGPGMHGIGFDNDIAFVEQPSEALERLPDGIAGEGPACLDLDRHSDSELARTPLPSGSAPSSTCADTGLADPHVEDLYSCPIDSDGNLHTQPRSGAVVIVSGATAILLKAIAVHEGWDDTDLAGTIARLAQGFAAPRMPALARAQADHDLLDAARRPRNRSRAPP